MAGDRPSDGNVPPNGDGPRREAQRGREPAEPRSRQEYYADQRRADAEEQSVAAQQVTADDQAAAEKWDEDVAESRWMWSEYQSKWPSAESPPVDRSAGPPGSWRVEGNRSLDRAVNSRVETHCDRIAEREQEKISPALRAIESQDPDRHLVGFEHCLKGRDRIKEKVYKTIKESNRSPEPSPSGAPVRW